MIPYTITCDDSNHRLRALSRPLSSAVPPLSRLASGSPPSSRIRIKSCLTPSFHPGDMHIAVSSCCLYLSHHSLPAVYFAHSDRFRTTTNRFPSSHAISRHSAVPGLSPLSYAITLHDSYAYRLFFISFPLALCLFAIDNNFMGFGLHFLHKNIG